MDNTFVWGLKPIDAVAIMSELMKCVKGCKLIYENEMVSSDYYRYIIDINFESYFDKQLLSWDQINQSLLDLARRSYWEKFTEIIEEQLDAMSIENELDIAENTLTRERLE